MTTLEPRIGVILTSPLLAGWLIKLYQFVPIKTLPSINAPSA